MPVMNGLDTAKVLWRIRPDLKILFCTGRQHQYDLDGVLAKGNAGILIKPFDLSTLAGKVREALSEKSSGPSPAPGSDHGALGRAA
jgi:DNA-binding NarL/FixJ family response regulator